MIKQPRILLHQSRPDRAGAPLRRSRVSLGELRSGLHGTRRFVFPFLAAQVKSHWGPARHALSQMVVAGVRYPSPPVRILVEKS